MSTTFETTTRPAPTSLDRTQRCVTSVATLPVEGGEARIQVVTYDGTQCSGMTWVSVMVPGVWDAKTSRPTLVKSRYVATRERALRVAQRAADYVATRWGA
jgi:hypothetical protein